MFRGPDKCTHHTGGSKKRKMYTYGKRAAPTTVHCTNAPPAPQVVTCGYFCFNLQATNGVAVSYAHVLCKCVRATGIDLIKRVGFHEVNSALFFSAASSYQQA